MKPSTRSAAVAAEPKSSEDHMEELMNKVCSKFVIQLEKKFEKLDVKLNDINKTLNDINKSVSTNQGNITKLNQSYDNLNQLRLRNTLRFNGIEEQNSEVVLNVMLLFINKTLNVSCSQVDIDYIYRVGKVVGSKPRPILINFVSYLKCKEVFDAKKLLKHSGMSIFEELTKPRYSLLQQAKKKYGKNNVWSRYGKIHWRSDGQVHVANLVEEF